MFTSFLKQNKELFYYAYNIMSVCINYIYLKIKYIYIKEQWTENDKSTDISFLPNSDIQYVGQHSAYCTKRQRKKKRSTFHWLKNNTQKKPTKKRTPSNVLWKKIRKRKNTHAPEFSEAVMKNWYATCADDKEKHISISVWWKLSVGGNLDSTLVLRPRLIPQTVLLD